MEVLIVIVVLVLGTGFAYKYRKNIAVWLNDPNLYESRAKKIKRLTRRIEDAQDELKMMNIEEAGETEE